jgi:Tol biopolymer transport system component
MTTDRWDRLAQIYQTAAELPPEARAAYLDEACRGDAALRREAESLLVQADVPVLIDRPVWEAAAGVLDDNPAVLPGTMIGPYRVESLVGEGGMGQVYRARDTALQRYVALKVLPAAFAREPDRLARFSREAQVLAALNHQHIAAIYGLERAASGEPSVHALVLEFVEGQTLADLIARGPLRLDEALSIGRQIAEALEAAHEQGIIHRDLKPANVKVRPDGTVKVLDFGLAKVFSPDDGRSTASGSPSKTPANLTTVQSPVMTAHGIILGTATYMAPEQARGRAADRRSDVWSFGCILFEMLSGTRAFSGDDIADTLAAILRAQPDWSRLPAETPLTIVRLLKRCLEKDPRRRLPAIASARFDLEDAVAGPAEETVADRAKSAPGRRVAPWVAAAALVVGAAGGSVVTWRRAQLALSDQPVIQFAIPRPENALLAGYHRPGSVTSQPQFAISPDGRHIVIVANTDGVEALWLRPLDTNAIRMLPGTEGASQPFWSPDSRFVAYFANGKLKKLGLAGGPPIPICDTGEGRGGSWGRDDVIVFKSERPETEMESSGRGLQRVPAGGGPVTAATTVDDPGVVSHAWPYFLPDGRTFLYVAISSANSWEIRVGALGSTTATRIGNTQSASIYGAGHIFFWRDGSVLAQRFDPEAIRTVGDPFAVAGGVGRGWAGDMSFSVSPAGTVVHAQAVRSSMTQLNWLDRAGRPLGTAGEPARNAAFALSPDARWIIVTREGEAAPRQQLWLIDVSRNLSSQFTFGTSNSSLPVWSPDGARVAFAKDDGQIGFDIFLKPAHADGPEERLLQKGGSQIPSDWSQDGRFVLFTQVNARDLDVWALPLSGDRKPFPITRTPSQEEGATFSPDGRWIAYQSDESGENEIFVQPFPAATSRQRITHGGGRAPQWRASDGKELYYFARDGSLMAVAVSDGMRRGDPQRLFPTEYNRRRGRRFFSVTGDGQRFLVPVYRDPVPATPLTVIVNWPATLTR